MSETWLDEDGRHVQLDAYLETWAGWNDLLGQLTTETGMDRGEAVAMIWASNARGAADSLHKLYGAFNNMADYHHRMAKAYHNMEKAWRESHATNKRHSELAERGLEIMEQHVKEADGDESWKDKG